MKNPTSSILENGYSVCRLPSAEPIPAWVPVKGFVSITRAAEALSCVCVSDAVPHPVVAEHEVKEPFHITIVIF